MIDEILNEITIRLLTQIVTFAPEFKSSVSIDISPKTKLRIE